MPAIKDPRNVSVVKADAWKRAKNHLSQSGLDITALGSDKQNEIQTAFDTIFKQANQNYGNPHYYKIGSKVTEALDTEFTLSRHNARTWVSNEIYSASEEAITAFQQKHETGRHRS